MYKAIDTVTSEIVAVKIIPLSVTEQDGFAEVKKEIEMLQVCMIRSPLATPFDSRVQNCITT